MSALKWFVNDLMIKLTFVIKRVHPEFPFLTHWIIFRCLCQDRLPSWSGHMWSSDNRWIRHAALVVVNIPLKTCSQRQSSQNILHLCKKVAPVSAALMLVSWLTAQPLLMGLYTLRPVMKMKWTFFNGYNVWCCQTGAESFMASVFCSVSLSCVMLPVHGRSQIGY